MRTHIETNIVGFTIKEWEEIRMAAAAMVKAGSDAGTLIFPDRPEIYRLEEVGHRRFVLRLTDEEELAATLRQEVEHAGR